MLDRGTLAGRKWTGRRIAVAAAQQGLVKNITGGFVGRLPIRILSALRPAGLRHFLAGAEPQPPQTIALQILLQMLAAIGADIRRHVSRQRSSKGERPALALIVVVV